jgi:hypothetical protein|tara:strand:+ start:813 stop:1091 length:279 start_codon:yes stop_codon:yes gene_type:complete
VQPTVRIDRDFAVFVRADVRARFRDRFDVQKERGYAHYSFEIFLDVRRLEREEHFYVLRGRRKRYRFCDVSDFEISQDANRKSSPKSTTTTW